MRGGPGIEELPIAVGEPRTMSLIPSLLMSPAPSTETNPGAENVEIPVMLKPLLPLRLERLTLALKFPFLPKMTWPRPSLARTKSSTPSLLTSPVPLKDGGRPPSPNPVIANPLLPSKAEGLKLFPESPLAPKDDVAFVSTHGNKLIINAVVV